MAGDKMFGGMMKQAQELQARMAKMQAEAGEKTVEATAGGGMVTVVVNGRQEVLSVTIDPEVVNPDDVEMLQDLVMAAVNDGIRKTQEAMSEQMKGMTGGMKIPGLFGG
ncbi:Nucleoid-associated protein YaaK [hydrothermal vent metagenome]|uniref:Nucleoid-associated protein YaaK n=1 Tax=hydrothermal vent metagenome TaxID=652676 RepID=A0A3B1CQD0_9ZZZZ